MSMAGRRGGVGERTHEDIGQQEDVTETPWKVAVLLEVV
jgi:hypothetical protein